MIDIHDVVVQYVSRRGAKTALREVSLRVEPGQVVGLLGPNGAGKTTLTKVLSTLLIPTSGSATVGGFDVERQRRDVQRSIGVSFGGDLGLYSRLSAEENLQFFAAMYGLPRRGLRDRIYHKLEGVDLAKRGRDRVETFSRGMRQRLHIARAMLHDPPVLILDEPTSGLDPVSGRALRQVIMGLKSSGRSILLTTHDMAEAEAVCDHLYFLRQGSIGLHGTPRTLRSKAAAAAGWSVELGVDVATLAEVLTPYGLLGDVSATEDGAVSRVRDLTGAVKAIAQRCPETLPTLRVMEPSLEEVYVSEVSRQ